MGDSRCSGRPGCNSEGETLGAYRVLRMLGSGGMGTVWLAEDVSLGRQVALKTLRQELLGVPQARERFLREARAAAAINHDNIVTIYQVGQENDTPFIAMELLSGESLERFLQRTEHVPLAESLRIGRQVAEGLAAAHERGLIHRDIKPANLWMENTGRVKILDFGLARPVDAQTDLTAMGEVLGTPRYMAPEQARGERVDFRGDLFSLGAVLYRLISGRAAFAGDSAMAVLTSLAVDRPKRLNELRSDVPPGVADLVSSLLAKRPEDRPASASAVVHAIREMEDSLSCGNLARTTTNRQSSTRWDCALARNTRWPLITTVAIASVLIVTTAILLGMRGGQSEGATPSRVVTTVFDAPPIKVGVLHSLSGTMADSSAPVVDATLLAIEELNEKGGLLGRPVEAIVRDGKSEWGNFAHEAERLIAEDGVCAIFGCWSSSGRKSVKPVVERHDHLLIYPVQYEGLELSPNIIYNGAAPNQQIIPAVQYFFAFQHKRRFFLIGSDYVFSRAANAIIRDTIQSLGGEVVGEEYVVLGDSEVTDAIRKLIETKADVILNTINGDSNRAFFRALRAAGLTPNRVPTVCFSVAEPELRHLTIKDMVGDYAAWNYFQGIDRPENTEFLRRFRAKYGSRRVVSDPMEAGYFGVQLWAQAVEAAGTENPAKVRQAIKTQQYEAPEGLVRIDPETQHTWKTVRLGRIIEDGQFETIWSSERPVRPVPYPSCRPRADWDRLLDKLYTGWVGNWANPKGH
jgi:urea transport system substrate-binding protein